MKNITLTAVVLLATLFIFSCGDNGPVGGGEPECETENLTYGNYAGDLIETTCWGSACHEEGTTSTFQMFDYASTKTAVDFGRIISSINHEDGFSNMPKGQDKMSDCNIDKLTAWINAGAPE